jgi:hypothetical protein
MSRQSKLAFAATALAVLAVAVRSGRSQEPQQPPRQQQAQPERQVFESLTNEQVEQRLAEVTRLQLHDVPLADAIQLIGTEHDLPVLLDRRALADVGIDLGTPVSADYDQFTLGTALELMLRQWDLKYVLEEGALVITTPEEAELRLDTRVYSVYDLVEVHDWMLPPEIRRSHQRRVDFDNLILLVMTTVNPASWDAVGGPGTISPLAPDLLVVTQTREAHDEVADILDTLRKLPTAADQPGRDNPEQLAKLVGSARPAEGFPEKHDQIRAALEEPTAFDYFDVPLAEVARNISSQYDIPVLLDHRALQDVGIDAGLAITASYRRLPLRQALAYLLREFELTYLISDEALVITTDEAAERRMSLRVYPVIDLVRMPTSEEGWLPMDFDSLIGTITTSIHSDSWDMVGGPGTIRAFPQRAALAIDQTQETHHEIESLLADLRRHRAAAGPRDVAARPTREQVVTQAHELATGDLSEQYQQALRDLIEKTARPDSWGSQGDEERFITFLPGKIVVHNRHDVQLEVRELLTRIGMIPNVQLGGGLGGGGLGGGGFGGGGFFVPGPEQ